MYPLSKKIIIPRKRMRDILGIRPDLKEKINIFREIPENIPIRYFTPHMSLTSDQIDRIGSIGTIESTNHMREYLKQKQESSVSVTGSAAGNLSEGTWCDQEIQEYMKTLSPEEKENIRKQSMHDYGLTQEELSACYGCKCSIQ